MSRTDGRTVGQAGGKPALLSEAVDQVRSDLLSASPSTRRSAVCNRCGFAVTSRAFGCKNPCANCGTVYPLGDCSD